MLVAQYGASWFAPALYGRPLGEGGARYQLFDPAQRLPDETAHWRTVMQEDRATIAELERTIGSLGGLGQANEIVQLRQARQRLADAHFQLARHTPGGYAPITSPLYGVPHNALFVGRSAELIEVGQALRKGPPVVIWGAGGIGQDHAGRRSGAPPELALSRGRVSGSTARAGRPLTHCWSAWPPFVASPI